jgi:predicted RNA-binding protein with PUA-like domain
MNYWLLKSEPDEFSFDDLLKKKIEPWTGVRNYQARNFLRDMKLGDKLLFYHSSTTLLAVVGIAEVIRTSYPDPLQFNKKSKYFDQGSKEDNPRWVAVDVRVIEKLKHPVTLEVMKHDTELQTMRLVKRGNRLSVMPLSEREFERVLEMSTKETLKVPP